MEKPVDSRGAATVAGSVAVEKSALKAPRIPPASPDHEKVKVGGSDPNLP